MCVIFVAETVRPSENMISAGFTCNPKGAGVAWRDDGKVHWKKGLDEDEIQKLIPTIPLPFICHFRVDTVGGAYKQLTHPFPIDPESSNHLEGSTKGNVLFHNGHYQSWKMDMRELAIKGNHPMPVGKYSDSRAMAWLASHLGLGFLELTEEKLIAFGPKTLLFFGGPWLQVNDIICSNRGWETCFQRLEFPGKPTEHDQCHLPQVYQPRKHMDTCVCGMCQAERVRKAPAIEVEVVDTPFHTALKEFRHADKEYRLDRMSKNQWKKCRHAFEKEVYLLTNSEVRVQALAMLNNPALLH